MQFQIDTTSHTKVTKLERNVLLGRGMDLKSLTWLLVTYVFFQMHTTPTLIQLACNSGDATTLYTSLFVLGGKKYHVIWLKLFMIHLEVHQFLEKQLQPSTNMRS